MYYVVNTAWLLCVLYAGVTQSAVAADTVLALSGVYFGVTLVSMRGVELLDVESVRAASPPSIGRDALYELVIFCMLVYFGMYGSAVLYGLGAVFSLKALDTLHERKRKDR